MIPSRATHNVDKWGKKTRAQRPGLKRKRHSKENMSELVKDFKKGWAHFISTRPQFRDYNPFG